MKKKHLLAGLFAAFTIGLLSYLTETTHHLLLIAPFGATSCIIFGLPEVHAARVRNIVFGYLICTALGFLALAAPINMTSLALGCAIGASIILMLTFDVVHPPAAGIPILLMSTQYDILFFFFPLTIGIGILLVSQFVFNKLASHSLSTSSSES
ncbi:MAG: HPP family protein [Xanthomonadaceae bacterium]|nr:HPP family protein [Xanthomonadaceae bacterium]